MMNRRWIFFLVGLFLLAASALEADPRWWWDERRFLPPGEDRRDPHLSGHVDEPRDDPGLFLVYAERDPAGGDYEIWMTASPDQGCSACRPVRLTDNAVDDRHPRIAWGSRDGLDASGDFRTLHGFQVAFEREGDIVVLGSEPSLPVFGDWGNLCDQIELAGEEILREGGEVVLTGDMPGPARAPDLDVVGDAERTRLHYHLAWEQEDAQGVSRIVHARNLAEEEAGWSPASLVSEEEGTAPAVAADLFEERVGRDEDMVTVAWLAPSKGRILLAQSPDSGTTWAPPTAISDSGGVAASGPALADSAVPIVEPLAQLWRGAAWLRDEGEDESVLVDTAFFDEPERWGSLPWSEDVAVRASATSVDLDPPVLAMTPSPVPAGDIGATGFVLWTESGSEGAAELFAAGARLDPTVDGAPDYGTAAFPPVQPDDPEGGESQRLSACEIPISGEACLSTRRSGGASQPSAWAHTGGRERFFAAWRDTRGGSGDIWFTRTDTHVPESHPRAVVRCSDAETVEVEIQWEPPPTCEGLGEVHPERLQSWRVYHGPEESGPYDNAAQPITLTYDPGEHLYEARLPAQRPTGERIWVAVVPADEAGNVVPSTFDPSRGNEAVEGLAVELPETCAPSIVPRCEILMDRCAGDPSRSGDGRVEPGETVEFLLHLRNEGALAARGYTARLSAAGVAGAAPPEGLVEVDRIAAKETVTVRGAMRVRSDPQLCGLVLEPRLLDQKTAELSGFPDAVLDGCRVTVGDGTGCEGCEAGAMVVLEGLSLESHCAAIPAGAGSRDSLLDPGERAFARFALRNLGRVSAQGLRGRLAVRGGTLIAGQRFGPVDLAPGEALEHRLVAEVEAGCGDSFAVEVRELQAERGDLPAVAGAFARIVGSDPLLVGDVSHASWKPFSVVEGAGLVEAPDPIVVSPDPPLDLVSLKVFTDTLDPDDLRGALRAPGGALISLGPLSAEHTWDVTEAYADHGPGSWQLLLEDPTLDGEGPSRIEGWRFEIADTVAHCSPCTGGGTCLYTAAVEDRSAFDPAEHLLERRDGAELALRAPETRCPFRSGDLLEGAVGDGDRLAYYQVNLPGASLRIEREGRDLRITGP